MDRPPAECPDGNAGNLPLHGMTTPLPTIPSFLHVGAGGVLEQGDEEQKHYHCCRHYEDFFCALRVRPAPFDRVRVVHFFGLRVLFLVLVLLVLVLLLLAPFVRAIVPS